MDDGSRTFIIFFCAVIALPFWVLFIFALASSWRASRTTGTVPKHLTVATDWAVAIALPFTLGGLIFWLL
jgi:hypothetical protein